MVELESKDKVRKAEKWQAIAIEAIKQCGSAWLPTIEVPATIEHVVKSVNVGDPIFVFGRIYTREWKTDQGELRVSYEVDAETVGHDLSRGVTAFTKTRFEGPHSVIEDEEHDVRINGEVSYAVGATGGHVASDHLDDEGYGSEVAAETADDALAILREAGLAGQESAGGDSVPGDEEDTDDELVGAGGVGGRRRRGR